MCSGIYTYFTLCSAVKDCDYVIHVASPFPNATPKTEDEIIKPAVEGTTNVLEACVKSSTVKRVVLTSSCVAIYRTYFVPCFSKSRPLPHHSQLSFTANILHSFILIKFWVVDCLTTCFPQRCVLVHPNNSGGLFFSLEFFNSLIPFFSF